MTSRRFLLLLVTSASCSGTPVGGCVVPQDCGGNPCCWREVDARDLGRSCEATSDGCVPVFGVDTLTTRLCGSDDDCTAGGVTTALTHCCQAAEHSWKACTLACSGGSP